MAGYRLLESVVKREFCIITGPLKQPAVKNGSKCEANQSLTQSITCMAFKNKTVYINELVSLQCS